MVYLCVINIYSFILYNNKIISKCLKICHYFHPTVVPTAVSISLEVRRLPNGPFSSTPRALQIAFIILGPNVAPVRPPTTAPIIPSSRGISFSFASCNLAIKVSYVNSSVIG